MRTGGADKVRTGGGFAGVDVAGSLIVNPEQRTGHNRRRTPAASESRQFTPVYGCWKTLKNLPLPATIRGARLAIQAKTSIRKSNRHQRIGTDVCVFRRCKSSWHAAPQKCHSEFPPLFTIFSRTNIPGFPAPFRRGGQPRLRRTNPNSQARFENALLVGFE